MNIKHTNQFSENLRNLAGKGDKKAVDLLKVAIGNLQNNITTGAKDIENNKKSLNVTDDVELIFAYEGNTLSLEKINFTALKDDEIIVPVEQLGIEGEEYTIITYDKSFTAKMAGADNAFKALYSTIKNEFAAYGIKNRISWKYEAFNKGRTPVAKMVLRGKTILLYLNLDPHAYDDIKKYRVQESPKTAKFIELPALIKVNTERKAKYAVALINDLAAKFNFERKDVPTVDYGKEFENENEKTLIDKKLIKVEMFKSNIIDPKKINVKMYKETSIYNIHKLMSNRDALNTVQLSDRTIDRTKFGIVYTDTLCKYFNDGETVTLDEIKKRIPAFDKNVTWYKLRPRGRMNKKLIVDVDSFTLGAAKMIFLVGGTVKSPSEVEDEE